MSDIVKHEVKSLVDQLYEIDYQILNPPPKDRSMISKVFGMSDQERRRIRRDEKRRITILQSKKASAISSFLIPKTDEGLLELTQMALANYKSADSEIEKQAWKNKFEQALVRMQATINADATDSLADEFLFMTTEFGKIKKHELTRKQNTMAVAISAIMGGVGALVTLMLSSQIPLAVGIVLIAALWVYRLFTEMQKTEI